MAITVQLTVTGMTCGGCENAVTRAVGHLPGVEAVSASHAANRVEVTFDPAQVTETALRARIVALGYAVGG